MPNVWFWSWRCEFTFTLYDQMFISWSGYSSQNVFTGCCCCASWILTHRGLNKIANILQATLWNVCSWMKIFQFPLNFPSSTVTTCHHWFWLCVQQAPSHYLNQWAKFCSFQSFIDQDSFHIYSWAKGSAYEWRYYICNIFFHWLRPCSAIDKKTGPVLISQLGQHVPPQ